MLKKMTMFLALTLAFALAGCGTSSKPAEPEGKKPKAASSKAADKAKAELKQINDAIKGLKDADTAALVKGLKHSDRRVRRAACAEVGKRKLDDPKIIEAMIAVLVDHDRKARDAATNAFVKIGEPSVGPLIEGWKKGSPYEEKFYRVKGRKISSRLAIKKTLAKMGAPAVPGLIKAFDSEDMLVRLNASGALGRMGAPGKPAIERMLKLVDDEVLQLRRNVVGDMSRIDPLHPEVKKVAEKALKDEDKGVQESGKRALKRIAEAEGKPVPPEAETAKKADSPRADAEKKKADAEKPVAKKATE